MWAPALRSIALGGNPASRHETGRSVSRTVGFASRPSGRLPWHEGTGYFPKRIGSGDARLKLVEPDWTFGRRWFGAGASWEAGGAELGRLAAARLAAARRSAVR